MTSYCTSYLQALPKKKISNFCKKCPDYADHLCDLVNDGAGAIARFEECDLLQEVF
jgi:hypothetical protein